MSAGWKGLAAELNDVGAGEPAQSRSAPHISEPAVVPQRDPADSSEPPGRDTRRETPVRQRRGKTKFTDTHRLVGVYLPHDVDAAFRGAAEEAGVSNSEFVVLALRAYLRR